MFLIDEEQKFLFVKNSLINYFLFTYFTQNKLSLTTRLQGVQPPKMRR